MGKLLIQDYYTVSLIMNSPATGTNPTLGQYIQIYTIRKKIEQRNKSKKKGHEIAQESENHAKMTGTHKLIDHHMNNTKTQLQDMMMRSDMSKQKLFFAVAKQLDQLMDKLKIEVTDMYKDVQMHYLSTDQPNKQINFQTSDNTQTKTESVDQKNKAKSKEIATQNQKKIEIIVQNNNKLCVVQQKKPSSFMDVIFQLSGPINEAPKQQQSEHMQEMMIQSQVKNVKDINNKIFKDKCLKPPIIQKKIAQTQKRITKIDKIIESKEEALKRVNSGLLQKTPSKHESKSPRPRITAREKVVKQ